MKISSNSLYKKVCIITVTISVFLIFFVFLLSAPKAQKQYIIENCPGYITHNGFVDQADFIDCRGIIGIEKYLQDDYFTVFDNLHTEHINTRDFKIIKNILYYIEDIDLNSHNYYFESEDNISIIVWMGRRKLINVSSRQDVPLYRKIDTQTGNFTLYKNLEEIPAEERTIFDELVTDIVNVRNVDNHD